MTSAQITAFILVLVLLGVLVFPLVNRRSFRKLPPEQQVRIIMKQAKGLAFFKNVSNGRTGVLYFVKNKRKILAFPWKLLDGKMVCTRENPFDNWDYPEEREALTPEEQKQLHEELAHYNKKNPVEIIFR